MLLFYCSDGNFAEHFIEHLDQDQLAYVDIINVNFGAYTVADLGGFEAHGHSSVTKTQNI